MTINNNGCVHILRWNRKKTMMEFGWDKPHRVVVMFEWVHWWKAFWHWVSTGNCSYTWLCSSVLLGFTRDSHTCIDYVTCAYVAWGHPPWKLVVTWGPVAPILTDHLCVKIPPVGANGPHFVHHSIRKESFPPKLSGGLHIRECVFACEQKNQGVRPVFVDRVVVEWISAQGIDAELD